MGVLRYALRALRDRDRAPGAPALTPATARPAGDAAACGGMHRDCWLKYDRSKKEYGPQVHAEGAGVMWTSGSSFVGREYDARTPTGRKYHVIITSGMSVYQQWQSRVRARGRSRALARALPGAAGPSLTSVA